MNSNNPLSGFDRVKADEALKQNTLKALEKKRQKNVVSPMRLIPLMAALLVVIGLSAAAAFLNFLPTAYISIDMNPSIELSLNYFEKVVSAKAIGSDGEEVLSGLNLKGMDYISAVTAITSNSVFQSKLKADSLLCYTVYSENSEKEEELLTELKNSDIKCEAETEYAAGECNNSEAAHAAGMSFGKYRAYLILKELDDSVTEEECSTLTMRELKNRIEEAGGTADFSGGNGNGNAASNTSSGSSGNNCSASAESCESGSGKKHQYGKNN